MLKKIGLSGVALLAMLTCIQPVSLLAADRDGDRYNSRYADARNDHEEHESDGRIERSRRYRDDRDDRDRDGQRYHQDDDGYRYDSFRR